LIHAPDPLVLRPNLPEFAQQLSLVPRRDGIYLLEFDSGLGRDPVDPYLGTSRYLYKRLSRMFDRNSSSQSPTRAQLRASVQRVLCWPAASRLESWLLLCAIARERFPKQYRARLKLRAPAFVSLLTADPFPRFSMGNRIPRSSLTIGPFRTRDLADAFLQQAAGLFQIRRCEEVLVPNATHAGCIYGEMNLCLRPCQLAVSAAEYATESHRAADFLLTDGDSLLRPLSAARDQSSHDMDFEQAARLHKQVEKIKAVCSLRGDLVRPLDNLHGIAVTRAGSAQAVRLWPLMAGYWQAPLTLDFASTPEQTSSLPLVSESTPPEPTVVRPIPAEKHLGNPAPSMDARLRESLNAHLARPQADGSRLDDLTLLSRWFYSSWRDGAWLAFATLAKLNYRKLVREISTLLRETSSGS
jgi:excinuclease ABC subunit C